MRSFASHRLLGKSNLWPSDTRHRRAFSPNWPRESIHFPLAKTVFSLLRSIRLYPRRMDESEPISIGGGNVIWARDEIEIRRASGDETRGGEGETEDANPEILNINCKLRDGLAGADDICRSPFRCSIEAQNRSALAASGRLMPRNGIIMAATHNLALFVSSLPIS